MITILYSIIMGIITLRRGVDSRKALARYVLELIIATCLGVGYGIWIVYSIVNAHIVDPKGIIGFLLAQETAVSGSLIAIRAAVDSVTKESKPNSDDGSSEDDGDED